jgi:hypothetical protein
MVDTDHGLRYVYTHVHIILEMTLFPRRPSHHFVQKSTLPLPISTYLTDDEPHINTSFPHHYPQHPSLQQSNDIQELKIMMKGLFDQLVSILNLLTTVLAKVTQWLNS